MVARKPAAKKADETADAPAPEETAVCYTAAVSRNADGSANEPDGFRLILLEGATDEDKAAAWNLGGELPPEDLITYVPIPHQHGVHRTP